MRFALLGACLALASFAVVASAASVVAGLVAARLARRGAGADTLLAVRASASFLAAVVAGAVVLPAFLAFEPARAEVPGPALALLAASGAALLGGAAVRVLRALRVTRALLGGHRESAALPPGSAGLVPSGVPAETIAHGFPLVAVVGAVAPRLVVASQVMEALEPSEMAAVVRHEAAHLAARDNLKALVIRALPDPLGLLPAGRRLEAAWRQAVEAEADAAAAAPGSRAALDLASALVKIARLVPRHQPLPVAEPALYDGGPLEGRVRRLTGAAATATASRPRWRPGLAAAALVASLLALTAATPLLFHVHGAIEMAVRTLR
jgi:Zn-dependent protease with chaperone function